MALYTPGASPASNLAMQSLLGRMRANAAAPVYTTSTPVASALQRINTRMANTSLAPNTLSGAMSAYSNVGPYTQRSGPWPRAQQAPARPIGGTNPYLAGEGGRRPVAVTGNPAYRVASPGGTITGGVPQKRTATTAYSDYTGRSGGESGNMARVPGMTA